MLIYILLGLLILAGCVLQGTIGFGLGTIATPIIALVAPELVPTVVLVLAFFLASTTLLGNVRQGLDVGWRIIVLSSLARIPGSLLAAWVLTKVDVTGLQIFIALAVILAMSLSGLGWSPGHSDRNTIIAGFTSGFLGTSTSVGGPPMALILKNFEPAKVRGTLAGTFVIGSIISLVTLTSSGAATAHQFQVALAYLPLAFLGLFIARFINRFVNRVILNRIVTVVALSAAALLLVESLILA